MLQFLLERRGMEHSLVVKFYNMLAGYGVMGISLMVM